VLGLAVKWTAVEVDSLTIRADRSRMGCRCCRIVGQSTAPPMRTSTAQNLLELLMYRANLVFSSAKHHKPTSAELSAEINEQVYGATTRQEKMPMWAKERLSIHIQSHRDIIKKDYTQMFYLMPDGRKLVTGTSWDNYTEKERQMCRDGHSFPLFTYWMDEKRVNHPDGSVTITRTPTDKVYYG
jgi:hypothetical protein